MISVLAGIAVGVAALRSASTEAPPSDDATTDASVEMVSLQIEGMT